MTAAEPSTCPDWTISIKKNRIIHRRLWHDFFGEEKNEHFVPN
jgi:hypothetical protein